MERLPCVVRIWKVIVWNRNRPPVAESFTVKMQVGRSDFLAIWIAMWRPAEIESGKNHDLPSAILIGALAQIDPSPVQIEKKRFTPID